ncbi:MAG TPA: SprT family zinc-dependent metalloprotease [Methylibium sp.]|nr:SprT family zinc-dependent metalloprotease [Methylibium sp.]
MHRLLQLTLDFFDSVAADPAPSARAKEHTAQRTAEPPAAGPTTPAPRLDELLQPAAFRHPRANREALLGNSVVAFEFKRARRRNIGFMVGPEGLTVSAPRWVPLYEVDAAVRSKTPWILRKLGDAHERQRRIESARIEWRDGCTFPFLGEPLAVLLDAREPGTRLEGEEGAPGRRLRVGLPQHAQPSQIRDTVQAWLMREAQRLFTGRLDHFAQRLGVRWRKLVLSNAGTRWGTAHSDGVIRLNWRLIHFRLPVIDYVVAHELSHLRVMDHSPRFWETVASVVPDYAQLRGQLKDEALPPW